MNKKQTIKFTVMLAVAMMFVVGCELRFVKVAKANPIGLTPAPLMPSITIESDGSIVPANVSIQKTGNVYVITGNIINCVLVVKCDNITLDGSGFSVREEPSYSEYAPACGITVYSNGVTIKNVNIEYHDTAITVHGTNNTLTNINFLVSSLKLNGNHNQVVTNTFQDSYLLVAGNHNTIKQNTLQVKGIILQGSSTFNTITLNTIEQCRNFAVTPSNGTNLVCFNNFKNNTYPFTALNDSSTQQMFEDLDLAILAQTHISPLDWKMIANGWKAVYPNNTVFDNGAFGNYWSDYNGADTNNDGVGDTPYLIGGNLQDKFPLTTPVDISFPPPNLESAELAFVPEFSSLTLLPLLLTAALVTTLYKKRLTKKLHHNHVSSLTADNC